MYYRKIERSYIKKMFIEQYASKNNITCNYAYKLLSYGKITKEFEEFKKKNQ